MLLLMNSKVGPLGQISLILFLQNKINETSMDLLKCDMDSHPCADSIRPNYSIFDLTETKSLSSYPGNEITYFIVTMHSNKTLEMGYFISKST